MSEQKEQGWIVDGNNMDLIINETKQFVDFYQSFEWDKLELSSKLSENISLISESLKSDEQFIQSLCNLLNNYEQKDDEIYKSLESLAREVWVVKISDGKWDIDSQQWQEKLEIKVPQFLIEWCLDDVKGPNEGEQNIQDFRNNLVKFRPDSEKDIIENRKLYVVIERINSLNGDLSKLLNDDNIKEKVDLERTEKLLEKILQVTDHTSLENVKFLQEFVYKNLDQNDDWFKVVFEKKNKINWEWDWLFGKVTLEWLDKVIWKFEEYVDNMTNYVNNQTEIKGKNWNDNEHGNWVIDEWESDVSNPENVNRKSFEWNGNIYSQAQNSWALVQSCWFDGANFYLSTSVSESWLDTGDNLEGGLDNETNTKSLDKNNDTEYLMEYNGNVYKVKFDSNWNLKPTAQNFKSEVSVLFENNKSCVEYLEWRLPEQIRNNCNIVWNGSNYAIRYKGASKWLIILPTTIDWDWIWKDLTESLTLLHFTNFLLKEGQIDDLSFENDSPDLKIVGDDLCVKVRGWSKGKWYPVPKESFALSGISPDDMKAFINFNNKDGWRDKSLLASSNMKYKRVKL